VSAPLIAVVGPECAGKSTLARALAERLRGVLVEEHARAVLEAPGALSRGWPALLEEIERGQTLAERQAVVAARPDDLVICDTDTLTTAIWSEALLGACPRDRRARAAVAHYDLTLLCRPDLPWADDPVRLRREQQAWFFARFQEELSRDARPYVVVSGIGPARFEAAVEAVLSRLGPSSRALR
jgi:HTH-type transcriptional repressor of NAD biosynthesis genes